MYLVDKNSSLIENKDIVCIYHYGCIDGVLSAALLSTYFNNIDYIKGYHNENIEYYESYIQKCINKNVYIVDYVPPKSVLLEIASVCKTLVVLDHHQDKYYAYKAQNHYKNKTYIKISKNRSGVGMTYDFMEENNLLHVKDKNKIKLIVDDMSKYDLWKHKRGSREEKISLFLRNFEKNSPSYVKKVIFDNCNIDAFYKAGDSLSKSFNEVINNYQKHFSTSKTKFKDKNKKNNEGIIIHNCGTYYFNELANHIMDKENINFVVDINTSKEKNKAGLNIRSNNNTAFEIAQKYNGGGHNDAAGTVISYTEYKKMFLEYTKNGCFIL